MRIGHVLPLTVAERNFRIYPTSTVASKFANLNPVITACGKYCKRRCTKQASLIWTYRSDDATDQWLP